MIVGQCQFHHRAALELAVDFDDAIEDGVHAEDGGLGWVDDWCGYFGSEDASIANSEGSTCEIFDGQFVVASLNSELLVWHKERRVYNRFMISVPLGISKISTP